jgi:hypothetical protein
MTEHAFSMDEQLADRFFLTDVCGTETYAAIQKELLAKHEHGSSGDLPEDFFAELSARLCDLFKRCAKMCEAQE